MIEKSLGERLVRTDFNPSADSVVDGLQQRTAELINVCAEIRGDRTASGDGPRCASIAITKYEEAAMWAVKAATAEKPQ